MESWLGGGVLLVVAAALWLVYLVPNWLRRSEYLATERNAVRLQQTIRVLAETAETPEAVRIESAAKARAAVAETLKSRPVAVGTAPTLPLPDRLDPHARATARLRRTRLVTTLVIVAAAVVLLWQVVLMIGQGIGAGEPMIVTLSGLVALAGVVLQGRLGRVAQARAARAASTPVPRSSLVIPDIALETATAEVARREWSPQPIPQPLGQLRREAAIAAARAEAARNAAATAEETRRSVAAARSALPAEAPEPIPASAHANAAAPTRSRIEEPVVAAPAAAAPAAAAPRPPSRFAAMGLVDLDDRATLDLDSALARRRAS